VDQGTAGRAPTPTKVVCLGGGWVALYVARALRSAIRRGQVQLTVVSRDNYQTLHGFIAEMMVGKIQPNQIIIPARRAFSPGRFLNAEIEAVDLERRTVTTSRLLDGRELTLDYDELIIAMGSRDDLSRFPGLSEHALRLRSPVDAFRARNHVIAMMEMAEMEADPDERRRLLTFVIAGGGYGGVEVATELNDYCRLLTRREYPGIDADEVRVVLVHSGDLVLPELAEHHANLQRWANSYVRRTELELRPQTRLAAATPTDAVLSSGERIPTRTIISATGTDMPPLLSGLPFERDDRGRIVTDEFTRVPDAQGVWAGGDCAAVPHPQGGLCPPLAIYAMQAGQAIGGNIARAVAGQELRRFSFTGLGDACSLGRHQAVAHLKGFPLYGQLAWVMWRAFILRYVPLWDRRIRIALDWILVPLFGREVTQMRLSDGLGMQRELYEPGQVIVREGDVGRRMCLIFKGEVEVVRNHDSAAEELLATLGPGDHFGETAVFEDVRRTATVRARTRVELVSLAQQEAVTLSETLKSFSDTVRRLPGRSPADDAVAALPEPGTEAVDAQGLS
jgi:NADH dehydrogenase